jgi:GxxExxY protein
MKEPQIAQMTQMADSADTPHHLAALTHSIIGAAMAVLNELQPGLDEKFYERALVIELKKRGHRIAQQKEFPVHYQSHFIGKLVPDLIVDDLVITDSKVVDAFSESHVAQMIGYLTIERLELALLLNFKHARLQVKRVIRSGDSGSSAPSA